MNDKHVNVKESNLIWPIEILVIKKIATILFLAWGSFLTSPVIAAKIPIEPPVLHQAVLRCDLMPVQTLLADSRINPNQRDPRGSTALHLAVQDDQLVMSRLLLAHNADPNLRDTQGRTPLDLARSWSIWWLLLTHGSMPGTETWMFLGAMAFIIVLGLLWLKNRPQTVVPDAPEI